MAQLSAGVQAKQFETDRASWPKAVLGGPDRLNAESRRQIMAMSGARPIRFWLAIATAWLTIAAAILLGVEVDRAWVSACCVFVISTRQIVLGLLMHEQVHRLGDRSRYGDWVVNAVAVYPLFVTTIEDYAKVHLSHHKYFMTAKDPDFVRKAGAEWTFPTNVAQLLKIALRDLSGLNTLRLIRGKTAPADVDEFVRRVPTPKWLRWCFYGLGAGILTAVGGWPAFLLYWLLPLLTLSQLFVRWIAVVEHRYNVTDSAVRDVTPLVTLSWWQRILMPDMNFAFHAYHHMHPGVSFSKLPRVHEIYRAAGLVDDAAVFRGQGAFLAFLAGARALEASTRVSSEASTPVVARSGDSPRVSHSISGRILIAEQNEISALVLQRSLAKMGYESDLVRDGHAATTRALVEPRPIMMFISSHLELVDGGTTVRNIREVERQTNAAPLPLVITTAVEHVDFDQSVVESWATRVLNMPFDDSDLSVAVAAYAPIPGPVPEPGPIRVQDEVEQA